MGYAGSTTAVDGAGSTARFHQPNSISIDYTGNVWVADTQNAMIRKINTAGYYNTANFLINRPNMINYNCQGVVSTIASGFFTPVGVSINIYNAMYVADSSDNVIKKVTIAGIVVRLFHFILSLIHVFYSNNTIPIASSD